MSATSVAPIELRVAPEAARFWWLKLVSSACWLLLSVIIFRFDWTTVSAISILFGVVMLGAAVTEGISVFTSTGWWRLAYALLALAFVVIGIVSFVHPGGTFAALAGVMSFYFVIKGGFTVVRSLMSHGEALWWIGLLVGRAELLLGFWAAGDFGHRAILLVVWVGAAALARGITSILLAFRLRA